MTYKVGLIGCGGRQSAHLEAFRDNLSCEVVAVVDINPQIGQAFAEKHDIPESFVSVNDMVRSSEVDIVTVVTRPKWIYQPVMESIQCGVKGILMEKPFGVNIEDSKKMLESAKKNDTTLLVNHQYRFFDLAEQMKNILQSGEFGTVEYMRAISAIKLHGQGTHMIDFARFLYNDRPFSWALGNFAGSESFDAKQIGPDYDTGILVFEDGVPIYVEAGRGSSQSPYVGNGLNLYVDVVCTKGRIWFGLSHGLRIWYPDGRYQEIEGIWPAISKPAQTRLVASLLDTIENGTENRCQASKAYSTQEALCGLLESGLTHQKINFPLNIPPGLMDRVRNRMNV